MLYEWWFSGSPIKALLIRLGRYVSMNIQARGLVNLEIYYIETSVENRISKGGRKNEALRMRRKTRGSRQKRKEKSMELNYTARGRR